MSEYRRNYDCQFFRSHITSFKTKCIDKIPVKKTCLVLSILYVVANVLLLIWWFYIWYRLYSYKPEFEPERSSDHCWIKLGGICWDRRQRPRYRDAIDEYLQGLWLIPVIFWLSLATVCNVIVYVFSVLLLFGVYYRRPGLLKAYFLFGVVATILVFTFSLVQMSLERMRESESTFLRDDSGNLRGLWAFLACFLHSLFLVLVNKTLDELVEESSSPKIEEGEPLQDVTSILPSAPSLHMLEDDDFVLCNNGGETNEAPAPWQHQSSAYEPCSKDYREKTRMTGHTSDISHIRPQLDEGYGSVDRLASVRIFLRSHFRQAIRPIVDFLAIFRTTKV